MTNYQKLDDEKDKIHPERWQKFSSKWMPDDGSDFCLVCKTPFGCCNRRHHCRRCGLLCCQGCSSRTHVISDSSIYSKLPQRICDNCYDYEIQREYFFSLQLPMLQKGAVFSKCPTSLGQVKKRVVRLTEDKQAFVWHEERQAPKEDANLPLEDVVMISQGQNTEAWKKFGDSRLEKVSFSICATSRTLDLACRDEKMLREWVYALEAMLVFLPRKSSPQEKRREKLQNAKEEEKEKARMEKAQKIARNKERMSKLNQNMKK